MEPSVKFDPNTVTVLLAGNHIDQDLYETDFYSDDAPPLLQNEIDGILDFPSPRQPTHAETLLAYYNSMYKV